MTIPKDESLKSDKVILIKGRNYLCENYRNKANLSHWRTTIICPICKKERKTDIGDIRKSKSFVGTCVKCAWKKIGREVTNKYGSGKKHPGYKGGRNINNQGYINILLEPNDPFYLMKNKSHYVMEHRYVMAKKLNRILKNSEHVHHINGNKQDNRIENLVLIDGSIHKIVTALEEKIKRLEKEIFKIKGGGLYH